MNDELTLIPLLRRKGLSLPFSSQEKGTGDEFGSHIRRK